MGVGAARELAGALEGGTVAGEKASFLSEVRKKKHVPSILGRTPGKGVNIQPVLLNSKTGQDQCFTLVTILPVEHLLAFSRVSATMCNAALVCPLGVGART